MRQAYQYTYRVRFLLATGILIFMTAGSAAAALPTTQLLPVVPGDEATRSTPFIAWFQDLTVQGYVEEEYTVFGMANIYSYVDDAGQQPEVEVLAPDMPYVWPNDTAPPLTFRISLGMPRL